ncbi:MAG: type IV toxin-antitoxin system AbiEi family antitoxin domain-containing protein [Gemmatimonadaceae bacterium]|nr:type IV toxin-antitoxin system AbiEi family antitoxin domain-containing protein [Gemmatimonadaceae bacterium]
MPGRAYNEIFELAADQHGLVTTVQAREHGIQPQTLVMMAQRGALVQVSRGVYRISQFPHTNLSVYMEAILWPTPALATLSHESALEMFGISDVNPSKVHVTVPLKYRVRRALPKHLELHRADLKETDLTVREGLRITTVERTIRDCHATDSGPAVVAQAILDAEQQGLITPTSANNLRKLCI